MSLKALFGSSRNETAARSLYETAVAQARRPEFYLSYGVEDSLDGRFDLLSLHMFLLLHRLGEFGNPAKGLAQTLFDLMFADMDESLREMGVSDLAVGGKVKTMAKALYGRISAYEPGLADENLLREALRRNLYRGMSVSDGPLALMMSYVGKAARVLSSQPLHNFTEGRVQFSVPDLP